MSNNEIDAIEKEVFSLSAGKLGKWRDMGDTMPEYKILWWITGEMLNSLIPMIRRKDSHIQIKEKLEMKLEIYFEIFQRLRSDLKIIS